MTDTSTPAPEELAGEPAAPDATDELATAQAAAEEAQRRVAELEAKQADSAAADAAAAEEAHTASLTPDVPEEPLEVNELPDGVRGVISEIFEHLGSLARTLGEHAAEIVRLGGSSTSSSSSSSSDPAPSSSSSSAPAPFARDGEPVAVAQPGTGDTPAGT